MVGFRANDIAQLIENAVYNALKTRFEKVSIGEIGACEIDFVAEHCGKSESFQVTMNCENPQTFEREVRSLLSVDDNYPKTVISYRQQIPQSEYEGIRFLSLQEFLSV